MAAAAAATGSLSVESLARHNSPAASQAGSLVKVSMDCWSNITAYLDRQNRRRASCASRCMRACVLRGAALHDCGAVNACVALFRQKAASLALREKLDALQLPKLCANDFRNLQELDGVVLAARKKMLGAMDALDESPPFNPEDPNDPIRNGFASIPYELGDRHPFGFMGDIFRLWLREQRMQGLIASPDTPEKHETLSWVARCLAMDGHFERAMDLSRMLPAGSLAQNELLQGIIGAVLVPLGHFEKAIEIAATMTDSVKRDIALQNISRGLIEARQLKKALEVAKMMHNELPQGLLIQEVAVIIARAGDIDKALDILKEITHEFVRTDATMSLIRYRYRKKP